MTTYIADDPDVEITDITDTLPEIVSRAATAKRSDRVFQIGDTFIKVRVARREGPQGMTGFGCGFFEVSGSECGEDGFALPYGSTYRISPTSVFSVMPDQGVTVDLETELAARRLECVKATLHAQSAANYIDAFLPEITRFGQPSDPVPEDEDA